MQFVAVWLYIFCLLGSGQGHGSPWALELLGIQWKALCCQVPQIQTWGAAWGVKNSPLLCKNWHLTFSESAWCRQTQGVLYIPWETLPGDVLFLIQCCCVLLKSCFPLTQLLLQFSDGLKQLSIFLIPLQGEL